MSDRNNSNHYQQNFWKGEFGNRYLERIKTLEDQNKSYRSKTVTTEEDIFKNFFSDLNRENKILEIGCNRGLKLSILKNIGFKNLYGLELYKKAYKIAKQSFPEINFINSSIEDFDSKGEKYDVVFTSTFLIHIHPSNLESVVNKMINLTDRYIFGLEYYSDNLTDVTYHGYTNVLWKQDFPSLFKKLCPKLKTIKQEKIFYKNDDLCDIVYLFMKT